MAIGTESALYQTIHRQPADLKRVLSEEWKPAAAAATILADTRRVFLAGMGTSYCAALAGAWMLRAAGADAWPVNSFDLACYPDAYRLSAQDVLVILSHSGVKHYSRLLFDAARQAGCRVVAIAGTEAAIGDADVVLRTTRRETSAAYTSSHLCAMAAIAQIATELGEIRRCVATAGFRRCLEAMPEQVEEVIERGEDLAPFARRSASRANYAVGAGPNEASAWEVVIKVREAAFGKIDGLGLEQYLHGPVVSLNAGDGVLLVNCPGASTHRVNVASRVFDMIGADMLVLGDAPQHPSDATIFPLPATDEHLSPMLSLLPMQFFAYHMAAANGVNPDMARRDTPKYASAIAELLRA